jgi:hypothetical protein
MCAMPKKKKLFTPFGPYSQKYLWCAAPYEWNYEWASLKPLPRRSHKCKVVLGLRSNVCLNTTQGMDGIMGSMIHFLAPPWAKIKLVATKSRMYIWCAVVIYII